MKKASEFKIPFSWEERRAAVLEKCLYIPPCYDRHHEWKKRPWREIFGNERPVCIEYCSGNGQWIAEKALRHPEYNWIAVEKQFDRARKVWARSLKRENLFVVCGEAIAFSRYYAPEESVAEIFVNFPDPWPKRRHAKHRLVRREFLEELARMGKRGARALFVTDDATYREQMREEVMRCSQWRPRLQEPHFTTEWSEHGDSFFKNLWQAMGRTIYYLPCEKL